jgi:hypothetical protein
MSKKAFQRPHLAPLQRVVAEPITDPAEQIALDKLHERSKRKQRGQQQVRNRRAAKVASNVAVKKRP